MKKRTVRRITVLVLAAFIYAGILGCSSESTPIAVSNSLAAAAAADQVVPGPNTGPVLPIMNLEGVWTYKSDKGGVFEAIVTDKSIKILMKTPDDTSLAYWNGTFDSNQTVGATVISKVGEDAFILSKAESKEFVVGIDTLTFDFTQAGKTKKVELRRA